MFNMVLITNVIISSSHPPKFKNNLFDDNDNINTPIVIFFFSSDTLKPLQNKQSLFKIFLRIIYFFYMNKSNNSEFKINK
jgi:hypothetical protein